MATALLCVLVWMLSGFAGAILNWLILDKRNYDFTFKILIWYGLGGPLVLAFVAIVTAGYYLFAEESKIVIFKRKL